MKYKQGFVAVCVLTTLILVVLIWWSGEERDEVGGGVVVDFPLVIRSGVCEEEAVGVQLVTSYAGEGEARAALRAAYPAEQLLRLGLVRVFLLARLRPGQGSLTQEEIFREAIAHRDIIQGDFLESYRNLTHKHIMGLKWAVSHCSNFRFIIKMDDDILVDMYELVNMINSKFPKGFQMMGYILKNMRPIKKKENKWYVRDNEFNGSVYPPFLSGWMYVTTPATVNKLLSVSRTVPYFWIDDLFVSGILAEKANVTLTNINNMFTYHPELFECCIRDKIKCGFIVGPSGGDYSLQTAFQEHAKMCSIRSCPQLPQNRSLEKTCVANRHRPSKGKGISQLKIIKL